MGDFCEIPHAEELKRKARFFAVKPQKMCYHDGEKVTAEALRIAGEALATEKTLVYNKRA